MACAEEGKRINGALWSKKYNFKSEFQKSVHHMVTEQEFEDGWSAMLDKYSLRKYPSKIGRASCRERVFLVV